MTPRAITLGPVALDFRRPVLMGILNITPDSFSDGGALSSPEAALAHARALVQAGAQILDVGGESTRPGAEPVDAAVEGDRVLPVIEVLARAQLGIVVSVDTSKAAVAEAALARGAHLVNDVSALGDPAMAKTVAAYGAGLVVMHMRGEPRTMQQREIEYADLMGEIRAVLAGAVEHAVAAGVPRERVMVDPGVGFGKTVAHNLSLTRHLGELNSLGCPIVYGASRKRFLGAISGREVADRDRATAAACALAVMSGAHVLRVHDVAAVLDAVNVATAVRDAP